MKKSMIASMLAIVIIMLSACGFNSGYSSVLDANWSFSLPKDAKCEEVYEKDAGLSFHGDGVRYHVFSYQNEEPIEALFEWSETESDTLFAGGYSNAAEAWLDEIEVPQEERPEYESCVYWYASQADNSEIIIFWDDVRERIYIVESFM